MCPVHCSAASAASSGNSVSLTAGARRLLRKPPASASSSSLRASSSVGVIRLFRPAMLDQLSSRTVIVAGDLFIPANDCRQQHRDRRAVRRSVTRGQRIGAGVCCAEHRVLDRDAGIVRAQLHRAACLEIVRFAKHALVIWLEQSPRFAREQLGKRIALRRDVTSPPRAQSRRSRKSP